MADPGWYPDPARRFQVRYFDGALWTAHVSNNGAATEDPVPVGEPADWQWTYCSRCGAVCRFDDDHCWKCVSSFPEARIFGPPPRPTPGAPIQMQFQAAQDATVAAFTAAQRAADQGRHKDAVRGFDEALWHRHFAEQLMMQLPKNGAAAGWGVSLLTMGLGPTDLIVGPLVRSFVNKRTQAKRERTAANDRLVIQAYGLLALANTPELRNAANAEHEVLVRLAFAYMPPGNSVRVDHSMPDPSLKNVVASNIQRVQMEFADLNSLLCDFAVYFQWQDLGAQLIRMGYPIGNMMNGERGRSSSGSTSGQESGAGPSGTGGSPSEERAAALRVLGLSEGATMDEIKAAYREMTKKYHPDRHTGATEEVRVLVEEKMREVNNAHDFLTR